MDLTPSHTDSSTRVGAATSAASAGSTGLTGSVSSGLLGLTRFLVGLSAGFFFTYEASVLLGLAEVDDVTYVETFQAINSTIRNAAFGIVFFGSLVALGVTLVVQWRHGAVTRALLGAALALYIVGFAITFAGNVPLNEELADRGTELTAAEAAEARDEFEDQWNRLNRYRTYAFVGSFAGALAAGVARRRATAGRDLRPADHGLIDVASTAPAEQTTQQ